MDILPYTQYQYQVICSNKAGETPSLWSLPVRSSEAAPDGVPAPVFDNIRSRSVRVDCGAPSSPNGIVRFYRVYMKKSNSTRTLQKVWVLACD